MSRGEVLGFMGAMGGAAIGWTLGEKVKAGGVGAVTGFLSGMIGAHLLNTQLLPPPSASPPMAGLGGYDPLAGASNWYYVDSWVWFIGGWTQSGVKGPFWATDYGATYEEDVQAFDAHQRGAKYVSVRRFRWANGWVKEPLEGDWSKKWSV